MIRIEYHVAKPSKSNVLVTHSKSLSEQNWTKNILSRAKFENFYIPEHKKRKFFESVQGRST